MRWKFSTAIEILGRIEPDPKIDRIWVNRSHILCNPEAQRIPLPQLEGRT